MRLPLTALVLGLCLCAGRARAQDRWFGPDKALHFSVSLALAAGSYAGSALWLDASWQRASVAAAFTLSVGALKELYDATGHGDPSLRDFTWDAIGCAVGVGLAYLIDLALRSPRPASAALTPALAPRAPPVRLAVRW